MLGSAQCQRCGTPLIAEDRPVPVVSAPGVRPEPIPVARRTPLATPSPGSRRGPTAPPPPPAGGGPTPPPPTPPTSAPPVGTARQQRRDARAAKTGCGCILPFVLAAVGLAGLVVAFVAGQVDDDGAGVQDEGTLAVGARERGGFGSGETDRWTLTGAGEVEIRVFGEDDLDATLSVRELDGATLGSDDDTVGRDPQLVVTLFPGRTYHVDVAGFGQSSGDYEIAVEAIGPRHAEGGVLEVGASRTGRVEASGSVSYRMVGLGREVSIVVRGDDGFDPVVTVFGPDRQQLGRDDDGLGPPPSRDSHLRITIPEGLTVTVEVTEFGGDAGSYTVEVT